MDMERRLEVESLTRELQVLEREEQELREKIDMIAIKKGRSAQKDCRLFG